MGYGRYLNKRTQRPGTIEWDDEYMRFQIGNVQSTITEFEKFIHGLIDSLEAMMRELFFEAEQPQIVLKDIKERMVEDKPGYSFLSEPRNGFENSHLYVLDLMMNSANISLHLLDDQGRWNILKAREYLERKATFLMLLMLGNICTLHH